MADAPPPQQQPPAPTGWRAIGGVVQQWQVLLPLVAGLFTLWFSIGDRRGKEIDLDREAVKAAHESTVIDAFLADPQNTLTEFRATYPPHAFCAALGVFIAENGRAAARSDNRSAVLKDADEALRVQVEALAMQARLSREAFQGFIADAEAAAGTSPADAHCPEVRASVPLYGAYVSSAECLLALDTFGQNLCNRKRREILVSAQNAADRMADIAYYRTVPLATQPADGSGTPPGPPSAAEPGAPAAPGATCTAGSPLIYLQFVRDADRARVAVLRDAMLRANWNMAAPELINKPDIKGDVRIYSEDQRPCAEQLAAIVGTWLGRSEPLPVISLADRYRSLPKGQMEIWLPSLD